ncbi:MAG: DNA polymerase III subunit delta', partial [Gammaproteobacteria bacterium]|nr:DNA polymerase III subunit delta' [Gammaproteobacteria bacterium]
MTEPADTTLLPWHVPLWERLMARMRDGRMPHALLLAGPLGLGKHRFAQGLAQALLCERQQDNRQACGACRACRLFLSGAHPDFLRLAPEEEGKAILVEPTREMCAALMLKSQYGGYKTALIAPAERMNAAAANSLLKTLEEPAGQTVLMLVSARPSALPATIRSRCQALVFKPPPRELALAWLARQIAPERDPALLLELSHGAPLAAVKMAQGERLARRAARLDDLEALARGAADPIAVAGQWAKDDVLDGLHWLQTWVVDMIRLKSTRQPPRTANPDIATRLQ